jgi:hypothetical protein
VTLALLRKGRGHGVELSKFQVHFNEFKTIR